MKYIQQALMTENVSLYCADTKRTLLIEMDVDNSRIEYIVMEKEHFGDTAPKTTYVGLDEERAVIALISKEGKSPEIDVG
jgi:hypothetical protein